MWPVTRDYLAAIKTQVKLLRDDKEVSIPCGTRYNHRNNVRTILHCLSIVTDINNSFFYTNIVNTFDSGIYPPKQSRFNPPAPSQPSPAPTGQVNLSRRRSIGEYCATTRIGFMKKVHQLTFFILFALGAKCARPDRARRLCKRYY